MRRYLHARRLSLLHQIAHRRPFHATFPRRRHVNAATDLPDRNKSLLSFLTSTNPHPPSGPAPHLETLSSPATASQTTLPQSPLTDPSLTAARLRHTTQKPPPDLAALSDFQRQLRQNPYARALASPVRQCALTGARLPGEFLLSFGLATHPKTGKLWHLPRMAARDGRRLAGEGRARGAKLRTTDHRDDDGNNDAKGHGAAVFHAEDGDDGASEVTAGREGKGGQVAGRAGGEVRALSSTYLLGSARAMGSIARKKRREYVMLLSHRWKEDPAVDVKHVVWREDMDGFVKGLLRRKVVAGLEKLAEKTSGQNVMVCNEGWEGVRKMGKVGGVLWFGDGDGQLGEEEVVGGLGRDREKAREGAVDALARDTAGQEGERLRERDGPPPYAMLRFASQCIPVYNVRKLLGEEHVKCLREEKASRYGGELTVIRSGDATAKVQQELWRLMGYLSNEGQWVE